MRHPHGKHGSGRDIERIARLFALQGSDLDEDEVRLVTRVSAKVLRSLVADGTIAPPAAGRYAWNDAAYIAAHVQWTPRYVAAALARSRTPEAVPEANRYERVEYELPAYLRALLDAHAARARRRHMTDSPSDALERIVADYFEGELHALPRPEAAALRAALEWPVESE